jgi:hypothetical protein
MDLLRKDVELRGSNSADFQVLAAIAANRASDAHAVQAAVMTTDVGEFSPTKRNARIPRNFYSSRRMVYLSSFSLDAARRVWAKHDAGGWQCPAADDRADWVREVGDVVRDLPSEHRASLLAEIQRAVGRLSSGN